MKNKKSGYFFSIIIFQGVLQLNIM